MLPVDAAWLALEAPHNPMTITVMMRVEGLTENRLQEFIERYWLAWERFRLLPVRKGPAWHWQADPLFALRHHLAVVPHSLDAEALQDWVSARLNQPLPDYRPRWKFWLVPHAEGGAALLLRIHHCYADGLALLEVFDRLCPTSPRQPPAIYGGRESTEPTRWLDGTRAWLAELLAGEGGTNTAAVMSARSAAGSRNRLEQAALRGVRLVNELSHFVVEAEDTPSPLRQTLLGRRRCCWSEPLPLAQFRSVARSAGVTINDVLLSCVASAVRQALAGAGVDLDQACAHAAVPVDIRSRLPDGVSPPAGSLGNYFGTVFVPLPVDGGSPLERLYRIKHETRRLKRSWQPGISWALAGAAALLPDHLRQAVAELFCRKASTVVSNVPGTREPRYLAGCRITEQMYWVPRAGDIGLGVSVVSYAGQVQFGIVADEAVVADPQQFLACCLAELEELAGKAGS